VLLRKDRFGIQLLAQVCTSTLRRAAPAVGREIGSCLGVSMVVMRRARGDRTTSAVLPTRRVH
jgi:hypothetical protein